jgi:hypothetical protein
MSVWRDKKGRYHVGVQCGGTRIHRICPETATWRDAKRRESEIRRGFDSVATGQVLIGMRSKGGSVKKSRTRKQGAEQNLTLTLLLIGSRGDTSQRSLQGCEEYKRANRGSVTNSTINRRLAVSSQSSESKPINAGAGSKSRSGSKIESSPGEPAREKFF